MSADDKKKSLRSRGQSVGLSTQSEVSAFLQKVGSLSVSAPKGRLLFALDATASREQAWDSAMNLQADMFVAAHSAGQLEIQLNYFRGFAEFYKTPWCRDSKTLLSLMTGIQCRAGTTQIERVLRHCLKEHRASPLNALVYIGDSVEENAPVLTQLAGQCGLLNIPIFVFQEGHDMGAKKVYQALARLSKGAYFQFDSASAKQLRELLSAVAVYASGGLSALEKFNESKSKSPALARLTRQIQGLE